MILAQNYGNFGTPKSFCYKISQGLTALLPTQHRPTTPQMPRPMTTQCVCVLYSLHGLSVHLFRFCTLQTRSTWTCQSLFKNKTENEPSKYDDNHK